MFIIFYTDGETFTEEQGTWIDSPKKPIARIEIRLHDSTNTISMSGYEKYYFANIAKVILFEGTAGAMQAGALEPQIIAKRMAGIDEEKNIVVVVTVWKNGNIETIRYDYEHWLKADGISIDAIR